MNRTCLALFGLLLASCGGAATYDEPEYGTPELEDPVVLERDQIGLETRLSEELARPQVDCPTACDLSEMICGLSDRICAIAHRHERDSALARRCDDSGARCESARTRVAERCTCE